jgi:hypothetical protein
VGEIFTAFVPVPLTGTVCGLLAAVCVMVMDPDRVPRAAGVKLTAIEQFPPAATDDPHVFV